MANSTDILELKFEGGGIKPESVRASELGILMQEFERAVLTNLKRENPAIDISEKLLVFETIKDESIGILLKQFSELSQEVKQLIVASYISLTACIEKGDYSFFSDQTVQSVKKIISFSKKYSCTATFKRNGESLTSINGNTEIKPPKTMLKAETTIYGELFDSGGENPNLHIKINEDYVIIVDTDKPTAKSLATRLYEPIGLRGTAKFDAGTSKIIEFKLGEILDYTPGNAASIMKDLKVELSGYWDKFNNDKDINNELLRE